LKTSLTDHIDAENLCEFTIYAFSNYSVTSLSLYNRKNYTNTRFIRIESSNMPDILNISEDLSRNWGQMYRSDLKIAIHRDSCIIRCCWKPEMHSRYILVLL